TLTVSSGGSLDVFSGATTGTTLTISGNLSNSGSVKAGRQFFGGSPDTFTLSGTFTNNSGGFFQVGEGVAVSDVANVGTLVNNGSVTINTGATLNLTNQPNGVTDVVSGSSLTVAGTFKAGANNALAKLNGIEGGLTLQNGQ